MVKIYILEISNSDVNNMVFFKESNFDGLVAYIQENFDIFFNREIFDANNDICITEEEDISYSIYSDNNYNIYTFDMDNDNKISFMQCEGPSSECCFILPKTKDEFFNEAFDYIKLSAKSIIEHNDSIKMTKDNKENYNSYKIEYVNSDLMTFKLYFDIVFKE
jgi:hypothetical protein